MRTALPRRPAVALAHALVQHVAAQADIRVIALKGPVLALHGLRPDRASSDADVLVEPGREGDVQRALSDHGWRVRFERAMPYLLERHSVPLLHPQWPVDIDLHWYFPGLHADPAAAFEALWVRRASIELAHRPVVALDLVGSAVVAAAHCARYPRNPSRRAELDHITERLRSEPVAVRHELLALARELRCATVLHDFLAGLDVEVGHPDLSPAERQRWRQYATTHELGSTGAWLHGMTTGRVRDRVRTALRAVWPTALELQQLDPTSGALPLRRRMALRFERWRRGLAAVPDTVRGLRRQRGTGR